MAYPKAERNADVRRRAGDGESFRDLADEYGVSYQRIQQIVRGPHPRPTNLPRIERGGHGEIWLHPPDRPIIVALKKMLREIDGLDDDRKTERWSQTILIAIRVIEQEC